MKPRKVIPDTRNQIDDFVCDQIRALGYEVVRDKKNCYKLAWGDFAFSDNILCAVDVKSSGDGITEIAGNVWGNKKEHERFTDEIKHCAHFGGEICFLIVSPYDDIKSIEDLDKWKSPVYKNDIYRPILDKQGNPVIGANGEPLKEIYHHAGEPYVKVEGRVLKKILQTMSTPGRYGEGFTVYFRFCTRENVGEKLINILTWFAEKK